MKVFKISHLVKSEDLNHHGTLFAGRTAEWLVEAGFVTAAADHRMFCVSTFTDSRSKGLLKRAIS